MKTGSHQWSRGEPHREAGQEKSSEQPTQTTELLLPFRSGRCNQPFEWVLRVAWCEPVIHR